MATTGATTDKLLCSVCEAQSIVKSAAKWCSECDETFCSECIKHHSVVKATRDHEVIGVEQYKKLPAAVLEIKQHCTTHGAKYQNYCRSHAVPCCKVCIDTIHKGCRDLPPLEFVIRDSKSSVALDDLECRLRGLKEFFEAAVKEKENNIREINMKSTTIEREIKNNKTKIIEHLDALEKQALSELSETQRKVEQQINVALKELKMKSERSDKLLEYAVVTKKYASDLQVFLCTKEMEKEVAEEEGRVEVLLKDSKMDAISLSFVMEKNIQELVHEVKSMGEIFTSTKSSKVRPQMLKEKQAQMIVMPSKDLNNINIELKNKINIPRGENPSQYDIVSGSVVLSDQRMLFSYDGFLKSGVRVSVIGKNGRLYWELGYKELGCSPYDVTCVDEKTVAVTCDEPKIIVINIERGSIERTTKTKHRCYGITCFDNKLLYSYGEADLEMQCLMTGNVTPLKIGSHTHDEYVTVHNNRVYSTNSNDNSVTCYDLQGPVIWRWRNEEIIRRVRGITVDGEGNVYVAGVATGNIVVITSDGNRYKSLIPDGIKDPRIIFFDKQNKTALICGEKGEDAGLFSVL